MGDHWVKYLACSQHREVINVAWGGDKFDDSGFANRHVNCLVSYDDEEHVLECYESLHGDAVKIVDPNLLRFVEWHGGCLLHFTIAEQYDRYIPYVEWVDDSEPEDERQIETSRAWSRPRGQNNRPTCDVCEGLDLDESDIRRCKKHRVDAIFNELFGVAQALDGASGDVDVAHRIERCTAQLIGLVSPLTRPAREIRTLLSTEDLRILAVLDDPIHHVAVCTAGNLAWLLRTALPELSSIGGPNAYEVSVANLHARKLVKPHRIDNLLPISELIGPHTTARGREVARIGPSEAGQETPPSAWRRLRSAWRTRTRAT